MEVLAIIPARGGSKGVPGKNIKQLAGKPLIEYTIEAALTSDCFKRVIVSTDDYEIAEISRNLGADVPFLRPKHLSTDESPTILTILNVVENLNKEDYDAICILQPTSPLRDSDTIRRALKKFISAGTDSLISVRQVPDYYNPHWVFEENSDGILQIATGEREIIPRRQDLPKAFFRDGEIYLIRIGVLLNKRSLYGNSISYLDQSTKPLINIDTMADWIEAERHMENNRFQSGRRDSV